MSKQNEAILYGVALIAVLVRMAVIWPFLWTVWIFMFSLLATIWLAPKPECPDDEE